MVEKSVPLCVKGTGSPHSLPFFTAKNSESRSELCRLAPLLRVKQIVSPPGLNVAGPSLNLLHRVPSINCGVPGFPPWNRAR